MIWAVVAIVVVIVILAASMVNRDDPFKIAATDLGLELTRTVPELSPRLNGMVDGIAAKIDVAGGRDPGIRYRVFYPVLGMALRLEQETTISRTLGQLGSGDQTIGAAEFDQRFRVNTSRPDAFKTVMTPDLQRKLVNLIDRYPGVIVADGEITLQTTNLEPTAADIITTTRDLVSVARLLHANRPSPLPQQPPPRPQPAQPQTTPQGQSAPAAQAPRQDQEPTPVTPPPAAPLPPAPVAQPVATGLPKGFFDNAFGTNRLSFEEEGEFDAIQGTQVTLQGKVKQSHPTRDEAGGTTAVITVAQIENDLYGKTDIDAVVYLTETVELPRSQTVVFTGTADKIDAFMRTLYVADASLVE